MDHYEVWLRDLEQNDDDNDVARVLHKDGELPNGDPRVDVLFRRAMRGNGFYSQLLQGYFGPI
jgi:hypothetical protein